MLGIRFADSSEFDRQAKEDKKAKKKERKEKKKHKKVGVHGVGEEWLL